MDSLWFTDAFKPFDLYNITIHPHDLPYSLENFPVFQDDNSIGSREHKDAFMEHIIAMGFFHLDVLYKKKSL